MVWQLNSDYRDNYFNDEGHATQGRKQPDDKQATETKYVMTCGRGIPAPAIVLYISLYRLAAKSLFPPQIV
jgi:hypothetical protein